MKLKKHSISKSVRFGIIGLAIIGLVFGSLNVILTLNNHKTIEKKVPVYSYNNVAQINYNVKLKSTNGLLEQKDYVEEKTYPSDLVSGVDGTFTYVFNSDCKVDGKVQYDITAVIEEQLPGEKGNRTILKKEIPIQTKESCEIKDNKINIKKNAPINIKDYKEIVDKINKAANINFETRLTIVWNVNIEAKTDKGIIKEKLSPVMEVSLKSNFFEVKGNLIEEKKGSIVEVEKVQIPINKNKVILQCSITIASVVILIFLIFFTSVAAVDDPLEKKLKQIFKNHGDRLVALYDDLCIPNKSMLSVVSIDDLVRVADEIHKPILYKKNAEKGEVFRFYVIDEESIYLLELETKRGRRTKNASGNEQDNDNKNS